MHYKQITALLVASSSMLTSAEDAPFSKQIRHELQHSTTSENERVNEIGVLALNFDEKKDVERLWGFLRDPSHRIRTEATFAISGIASSLTSNNASAFAAHLQREIDARYVSEKLWEKLDRNEMLLLCRSVYSLNKLRFWHPLVSIRDYHIWQEEVMFGIVTGWRHDPESTDEEMDSAYGGMLFSIMDPAIAERALMNCLEQISELSPELVFMVLDSVNNHLLFGLERPMRRNAVAIFLRYKKELREKSTHFKDEMSRQQYNLRLGYVLSEE